MKWNSIRIEKKEKELRYVFFSLLSTEGNEIESVSVSYICYIVCPVFLTDVFNKHYDLRTQFWFCEWIALFVSSSRSLSLPCFFLSLSPSLPLLFPSKHTYTAVKQQTFVSYCIPPSTTLGRYESIFGVKTGRICER
jgi:hypothetical protein